VGGIAAIGAAHAAFGTTGFLPTLISDDMDRIAAALDAADAAIAAGVPGVLGVHIEGPFLNVARKGIHDAAKLRRLDEQALALLTRPRAGKVMLTLAPELCDPADIRRLADAGVIVSAGHSNADHATVVRALAAGLRGFTHLFNAMSPLLHRAPGVVGAALDDPDSWCGLIVDGVHVDPVALRIALRAKNPAKFMLVTDAMPNIGTTADSFMLQGKSINVAGGTLQDDDGTLAGADLDMAAAVRNAVRLIGVAPETASMMAAGAPAAFLSLSDRHGTLAPGQRADWVWLDADLHPRGTWIGGQRVDG
jgi:N-acetylglucosamine-6-phosphate deacetylase